MAVTNESGAVLSQQRYLPFGGVRAVTGSPFVTETDLGYTGQRSMGMGLMDYKARFYSPSLMRFTQPDSMIPGADNPQNWNRYSYVQNRPVNYNDPTGHMIAEDAGYVSSGCHTLEECFPKEDKPEVPVECKRHPELCDDGTIVPDTGTTVQDPDKTFNCKGSSKYAPAEICFQLSADEMQTLYGHMSTFSTVNGLLGVASMVGGALFTSSGVVLWALGLTALSAAAGAAILAAAPGIAAVALVAGIVLAASAIEMSSIQTSMFETGAGELGGEITISDYILFKKYTVTTEKGTASSWGLTNLTEAFTFFDSWAINANTDANRKP